MRCNETELKFVNRGNSRAQKNAIECRTFYQNNDDLDLPVDENDVHIERTERGIFLSASEEIQVRKAFWGKRLLFKTTIAYSPT